MIQLLGIIMNANSMSTNELKALVAKRKISHA